MPSVTCWPRAGRDRRSLRARVVLEEARALGLTIEDLIAADEPGHVVPTVAEFVATMDTVFGAATARTYRPYWRLAVTHLGDRHLHQITIDDLAAVVTAAAARAQRARPASTGRASRETCVAALRALFARAAAAGLVSRNPAAGLAKPRRARSRRRALDDDELSQLVDAVCSTSRDPGLDILLVRFHLESAARRQGALGLRLRDLDAHRSTVWLAEKGDRDRDREQPISPSLTRLLADHATSRGAGGPDDAVLRTRDGRPISARRYDTVFGRARDALGWSERTPVSAHVLRHTAITSVGRLAGYPVAQAFAGHAPPSVTGRYLHATLADVAGAVAALTGERHPLAMAAGPSPRCPRRAER